MIDHAATLQALHGVLEGVASQLVNGRRRFDVVVAGVGRAIGDVGSAIIWWVDGEDDETQTLATNMRAYRIGVILAWRHAPVRRASIEHEVLDSLRAVKAAIRSDSDLGGRVTRMQLTPASRSLGPLMDIGAVRQGETPLYDMLTFDIIIDDYEGEEVAP